MLRSAKAVSGLSELGRCTSTSLIRPGPVCFAQRRTWIRDVETTYAKLDKAAGRIVPDPGFPDNPPLTELPDGGIGRILQLHEIEPSGILTFNEVVKMGRHTQMTAGGRALSFSALVIAGNTNGSAGIGYGKADRPSDAIISANRDVEKNIVHIYRYQNRTIPNPIYYKFIATKLYMWPRPPNHGLNGHIILRKFAVAFGLNDMTIKVHGSHNIHNMLRAMVKGLNEQTEAPEELARKLGKKFFNINRIIQPNQLSLPPVPYSAYPSSSATVQPWRKRRPAAVPPAAASTL